MNILSLNGRYYFYQNLFKLILAKEENDQTKLIQEILNSLEVLFKKK